MTNQVNDLPYTVDMFTNSINYSTACAICGRELTDPVSVSRGIGPICSGNGYAGAPTAKDKTKMLNMLSIDNLPEAFADYKHAYSGYYNDEKNAICRVRYYDNNINHVIIISTEIENTGLSITNGIEKIATEIRDKHSLRSNVIWVEHYPERRYADRPDDKLDSMFDENFSLVTFQTIGNKFSSPKWKHLSKRDLLKLIGETQ